MDCHPKEAVTYPPRVGATIGDRASTNISRENIFAFSSTGNKSLTNALAATIPPHAPTACKNLIDISAFTEDESKQPIEVTK